MIDTRSISDPATARLFANRTSRSIIFSLMQRQASLKDLHLRLGFSMSLLSYHVSKLRRFGLVKVEESQVRAGRPIAVYAAVGRSFVVPTHLLERSPTAGLKAELENALHRNSARFPPASILFELADDQTPRMRRMKESGEGFGGEWWGRINLAPAKTAELTREIRQLVERYTSESDTRERTLLLYCAFAPAD